MSPLCHFFLVHTPKIPKQRRIHRICTNITKQQPPAVIIFISIYLTLLTSIPCRSTFVVSCRCFVRSIAMPMPRKVAITINVIWLCLRISVELLSSIASKPAFKAQPATDTFILVKEKRKFCASVS